MIFEGHQGDSNEHADPPVRTPAWLAINSGGRDNLPDTTDTFVGGYRSRSNLLMAAVLAPEDVDGLVVVGSRETRRP